MRFNPKSLPMPNLMTSPLTATGRALFALVILGFGIQYAI
jgi:hypothetical protein